METLAVAICGLNATLIAALIWILKFSATRLLGKTGELPQINKSLQKIDKTLALHAKAIESLEFEIRKKAG